MLVSSGVFSSLLLLRHKNGFLCFSTIDWDQRLFSKLKKQSKEDPSNLYADVLESLSFPKESNETSLILGNSSTISYIDLAGEGGGILLLRPSVNIASDSE